MVGTEGGGVDRNKKAVAKRPRPPSGSINSKGNDGNMGGGQFIGSALTHTVASVVSCPVNFWASMVNSLTTDIRSRRKLLRYEGFRKNRHVFCT